MAKSNGKTVKPRTKSGVLTKAQITRELELQLVRYTRIWRYTTKSALFYMEQQGHKISESKYFTLKTELKTKVLQGEMFTKEALDNLQVEHGDSLELINGLLDTIINEIRDHSATAIFNVITDENGNKTYTFAKNHNSNIVAKLVGTATDLMKQRDDTIIATPVIMSLVEELNKGNDE